MENRISPRRSRTRLASGSSSIAHPVVMHIGVIGELPGGMAQVVNEYLHWSYSNCRVVGVLSTKGKGDRLAALRWLGCMFRLAVARLATTPHVVVVHLSQGGSFIREGSLLRFAAAIGVPAAAHLHGSGFQAYARSRPALVSKVLSAASLVFSLTDATNELVEDLLSTANSDRRPRLARVMNAVALPSGIPEKENFVFFAGELGFRKGTDVLLAAWSTIAPRYPGWTLRLAGPLMHDLAFDDQIPGVVAMGVLPRSVVLELQGRAAIAVLPSRHEALPMFLIESMAHECATIGTPVGQVGELLADAGLLVEVGHEAPLAVALERLMTNEEERRMLGKKARLKIRDHYSEEAVSKELESEWLSMLGGPPTESPAA